MAHARARHWFPALEDDLGGYIVSVTQGHIGAATALLNMAALTVKDNRIELRNKPLSFTAFMARWSGYHEFLDEGLASAKAFTRGLPKLDQAIPERIVTVLIRMIDPGFIILDDNVKMDEELKRAAAEVQKRGWAYVHRGKLSTGGYQNVMTAASPLHVMWLQWLLAKTSVPSPELRSMDLDTFWRKVVFAFSSSVLHERHSMVPTPFKTFAEAQFQNESYRASYAVTRGYMTLSPEYSTPRELLKQGRIDFFIKDKKWGIEILRDGDKMNPHIARFLQEGAYHPWVATGAIEEYVLLDFRMTKPTIPHPGFQRLFHIVVNEEFRRIVIYNHVLAVVAEGMLTGS